jgi:phosphopantothenoylcysteine decarboxylase/phosphopantothenate--cysteine ligase
LEKKNADMICANSISRDGEGEGATGFAVDTNKVTIITRDGMKELPLCSKEETADMILTELAGKR